MKNNREFFSPKKVTGAMLCFLLLLCFSACSSGGGGEVSEAETPSAESGIYSQEDIAAAIDVIKKEFKHNWQGCTLTEIYYAGDRITNDNRNLAEKYNADEVIILLSSFDVDASGGDGSLNPNSTYDGWMWILVRTKGGQWQHVDHGY